MSCALIGDSIAVGIAQNRPECVNQARVGRNTAQTIKTTTPVAAHSSVIMISVGSNDFQPQGKSPKRSIDRYKTLRSSLKASMVIWVLPNNNELIRQLISTVAIEWGDCVIDTRPVIGKDQVHPTARGYKQLAQITRQIERAGSCAAK